MDEALADRAREILRCPACGSEVIESEGVVPPRLVCGWSGCDWQDWPGH